MSKKYFGTDGIRGKVGQAPITADFMLKLGWAAGKVLSKAGRGKVLIGKDTRISGYMFEASLQAGLAAAGVDVYLLGPMPTPAIAYLARTQHADAGIVISASHNPYGDNGIKFFSNQGTKLDDETEHAIEAFIDKPLETVQPADLGKAFRMEDAAGRYIEFCKRSIPIQMDFSSLHIVLDCANGANYHVGPKVFSEMGAQVTVIANKPDGLNINVDCGSTHPTSLCKAVVEHSADIGIAFDGDGDRVLMVDHQGNVVDGDQILYVIAKSRQAKGKLSGPIVGTLMTNLGLEKALKAIDVELLRANVGDRYVMEKLYENQGKIGGENSGHIVCLDRTTTGDGIISSLQVVKEMVETGAKLSELVAPVKMCPQRMINVPLSRKFVLDHEPEIQRAVTDTEANLEDRGRVLLRPSGTEPVVRVMVEGECPDEVEQQVKQLASVVEKVMAAS